MLKEVTVSDIGREEMANINNALIIQKANTQNQMALLPQFTGIIKDAPID